MVLLYSIYLFVGIYSVEKAALVVAPVILIPRTPRGCIGINAGINGTDQKDLRQLSFEFQNTNLSLCGD